MSKNIIVERWKGKNILEQWEDERNGYEKKKNGMIGNKNNSVGEKKKKRNAG